MYLLIHAHVFVKVSYLHSTLIIIGMLRQILVKLPCINFIKICSAVLDLLHAYRQTDGLSEFREGRVENACTNVHFSDTWSLLNVVAGGKGGGWVRWIVYRWAKHRTGGVYSISPSPTSGFLLMTSVWSLFSEDKSAFLLSLRVSVHSIDISPCHGILSLRYLI
jgi:hypothetical protein